MSKKGPAGCEQVVTQNGDAMSSILHVGKNGPAGGEHGVVQNGEATSLIQYVGEPAPARDDWVIA